VTQLDARQHGASQRGASQRAIVPGAWLGVIGGGQLGRMFCMAAQTMGYKVAVLEPDVASPAGACADLQIQAAYTDVAALDALAERCAAVTTEFENVPAPSLLRLSERLPVSPAAACVSIAQDRRQEKKFIQQCGIRVAPFVEVNMADDLERAPAQLFPALLKSARLGYDGKGQAVVADRGAALAAFKRFGEPACVLEQRLVLAAELSVVLARGFDGESVAYPVAENVHHQGILARTVVPARIAPELATQAIAAARTIAEVMNYAGVLCVEFFLLRDGSLVVNELAPRPHNSGHFTIDACVSSQFEQQVRIMTAMPLGNTALKSPAVMINLLGDIWFAGLTPREPDWSRVLGHSNARLHLYGKQEARRARKMGHITIIADTLGAACSQAAAIELELGIRV
jgi:5-(carboxyamino)imidazole ribonucleotide synthase